jgi:hypothetical protein
MGRPKKSAKFEPDGFLKGLHCLLDTLPSASQKQEMVSALDELIHFFADLQNTFRAMPSSEDASQIGLSLMKLEELFASVEQLPTIAEAVGAGRGGARRSATKRAVEEVEVDIHAELAALANLSVGEIRSRLNEKRYSVATLRAIAADLGARPDNKATRKILSDKIANDIVNQRMLAALASGPGDKSSNG